MVPTLSAVFLVPACLHHLARWSEMLGHAVLWTVLGALLVEALLVEALAVSSPLAGALPAGVGEAEVAQKRGLAPRRQLYRERVCAARSLPPLGQGPATSGPCCLRDLLVHQRVHVLT